MEEIIEILENFVEDRKWKKFHTPKNLAISMAIEVAELLEHFQWESPSFDEIMEREDIAEEVADVMIYSILFLHYMGKNAEETILKKVKKNTKKHPA